MTEQTCRGATSDEWFHFDFVLGLGGNLLPCVPAGPDVKVLAGSALEGKVGKIPSQFNHAGEAHGLTQWQKRPIMGNEIVAWSKDPRLNICVRTGPISGCYAFDVDVDDIDVADEVRALISQYAHVYPAVRGRENSSKILIPFRMEQPCKKRRIKLDNNPKGPAIELLADGQQFVAAGSHSSGVRYRWLPCLPEQLPTLTLDQVNQIWAASTRTFATPESAKANQTAPAPASGRTLISPTPLSPGASTQNSTLSEISEAGWQELLSALRFLLDKVADNDTWSSIGYALLSLQTSRPAMQLWIDFSKKAAGYEPGAPEAWWEAHKGQTPRSDWRHILNLARKAGLPNVADPAQFSVMPAEGGGAVPASEGDGEVPAQPDTVLSVVPDGPVRPVIQVSDARFSAIVRQLEDIMVPHVYVQGPHLVRQSEAHTDSEITRQSDALMLIHVTKAWATTVLGEMVDWKKFLKSDNAWIPTKPSVEHIHTLLDLGGWTKLRPLEALQRSPFVREDGSICDQPGYDSRSRVLYVPSAEFPAVPADPGYGEANASLERLRGVFDQFPWKERASESAFLSHILSEAARTAIDRCPMFFYDAPSSGTGKSLLQEMAARIVHGTDPAMRAWVGDGDEIRKSLYAAVLAGDRSLWFDNVPDGHKIRAPELCGFISSSHWTDRKLGESESLKVPNKVVLVASGNNITPAGDMARRSLVVRMDANTARLKERVFRIPMLRSYVMENRAELLVHALTIIKAFHAATDIPNMPIALPGFERWSHFCRDPLIWLGMDDPIITQEHETDDETSNIGDVFVTLRAHFGENAFAGYDVARLVGSISDENGELARVLVDNGCSEPNNPTKVGYWLRGCRDRIGNGLKLVRAGRSNASFRWKFVSMNEDLT